MTLLVAGRTPEPVCLRLCDGVVAEVAARLEPHEGEPVVDLGGRFVRRGLRDAHVHFAEWARSRLQLDLSAAVSATHAADTVRAAAAALPPGAVLRGGGFRDATWPEPPAASLLDAAAPGRAVVLQSQDMHTAWLSRAALALVGLPDHPTGLLREHACWDALARVPAPGRAQDDEAARLAVDAALARGVTALRDFEFGDPWEAWSRRRAADGSLPVRVSAVVQRHRVAAYADQGLRTGSGDAWLRVGPVKLFVDGSLGSRTARCFTPYAGTGDRGQALLDPDALRAELATARAAGFVPAVHAIGDEANRDALVALADAGTGGSVEHAQLLRREDLALFAAAGVTASLQPAHLLDDAPLVEHHWAGTTSLPYAVRSVLDAGARVVLGSDAPVSPLDPWRSIAAAVHRTDGTMPPWHPQEAVPLEVALAASGARRVRPGDVADLVVLDVPDPAVLSPADLAAAPVHATCVGGRWHGTVRS